MSTMYTKLKWLNCVWLHRTGGQSREAAVVHLFPIAMDADGKTINSSSSVFFFFHRKALDMHSLDMNVCKNVKEGAVKEMQNGLTACQK